MFDLYFDEYLKLYPSVASFLGDRRSDDRVEISISPAFLKKWRSMVMKYAKKLASTNDNSIDVQLLKYTVNNEIAGFKYPLELMPISSFSNPVIEFTFMERTIYPSNKENCLKRHKCYVKYIKQCILNMRKGISEGYTIPQHICQKVIEDLSGFVSQREYIVEKDLENYFETKYKPTLDNLLSFLNEEYLPQCRETHGICYLPKGKMLYKYLLKVNTTLPVTPEEIHELGKKEVSRIRKEFVKLMPPSMKPSDVMLYIKSVQEDPANYMRNAKEVMTAYEKKQKELRSKLIPKYFYKQVAPYEIKRVPKMLEASSAGAFYYPGTLERPGRFFINLRDTKENPRFTVETLAIHEGEPGHHYQFQYMLEKGLPKHRIFGIEGNAFAEGWALYAESLSSNKDPYVIFGRLTYEMFRAVRCVVDTGIHYYGWTFAQALEYMKKNIAMKESELISEINRYICIPGQATAYKVGEQFFLEERKKFLDSHPTKTIKDYHKLVLDEGVLPLNVLRNSVL